MDPGDDAAHINLGEGWRVPTKEEWDELINNCNLEWTTMNGVKGQKATGPNGNSIFLPAAGGRYYTYLRSAGQSGVYWSSIIAYYPYEAYMFSTSSYYTQTTDYDRFYGCSIRPVYTGPIIPVESISLNKNDIVIYIGERQILEATIYPSNATNNSISWSSDNESIATVSAAGEVNGLAEGTTTIIASTLDGGHFASCQVVVKSHGNEGITPGGDINM